MRTLLEAAILLGVFGALAAASTIALVRSRGSRRTRNQRPLSEEESLQNARPHRPWVTVRDKHGDGADD